MFISIAVLAAFLCSRLLGTVLFSAVLFGTIGLFLARLLVRAQFSLSPYPLFVTLLLFGIFAEIVTALGAQSIYQDNLYGAWLFFLPSLFFLFYSPGIGGAGRKLVAIGYAVLLMLLNIYASQNLGEKASYCFLPMQLSLLYTAIYTLKQKNGA